MSTEVGIGLREAARSLSIEPGTIRYWIKRGWIKVIQEASGQGKPMILDRQSVMACHAIRTKKDKRYNKYMPQTMEQEMTHDFQFLPSDTRY